MGPGARGLAALGIALAVALAIAAGAAPADVLAPAAVDAQRPAAAPASIPAGTVGWIDAPEPEAVVANTMRISGWALDPEGIDRIEIRVDGRPEQARYGLPRADVAKVKPGYPAGELSGFEHVVRIDDSLLQRHRIDIAAINRAGKATLLGRRSLIAPKALALWRDLAADRDRAFAFLMALSAIPQGGALEADTQYAPYRTATPRVGIAVPILYLRTTTGRAGDWTFDAAFDLSRKCQNRLVAEDNLKSVIEWSIAKRIPVQFILNGGIWADASCDTPEWDINDELEKDAANCQWTQFDTVLTDDHMKGLVGSTDSPELGRSLTYHVYAAKVRAYKKRNLQAAAAVVAQFAREHPDLFVGINVDADTYMNPFPRNGYRYDYNPGMLRQFREWLAGTGPYAGRPEPGVPDLSRWRRKPALTLRKVNAIARAHWRRWDQVDPPRRFSGDGGKRVPGETPFWEDPWYLEWDAFRRHIVALHYSELSQWAFEAGLPRERIFSAQAFIAPDPGMRPVAIHIRGETPDYDSAGVSIEGSVPTHGHLGTILYGPASANEHPMNDGHSLFATIARLDPSWAIVEMNATDLKQPMVPPEFARWYHAFREMFNFDARQVTLMAWNGSNGIYVGQPGYVPYTSWRNTPGEEAMRDFMVTHANLPLGSRLWTFGAPGYLDDDGWYLEAGLVYARGGYLDLAWDGDRVALLSPRDQVLRTAQLKQLVLGVARDAPLRSVRVQARLHPGERWRDVAQARDVGQLTATDAGWTIPLAWPREWGRNARIAEALRIELSFASGTRTVRLDRIALLSHSAATRQRRAAAATLH